MQSFTKNTSRKKDCPHYTTPAARRRSMKKRAPRGSRFAFAFSLKLDLERLPRR